MVFCYCLKYSSNDYSYLKQSPFSIFACYLFVQKCDILLGGPRFVTVCDRGGGKNHQKSVTYFMDGLYIGWKPIPIPLPPQQKTHRVWVIWRSEFELVSQLRPCCYISPPTVQLYERHFQRLNELGIADKLYVKSKRRQFTKAKHMGNLFNIHKKEIVYNCVSQFQFENLLFEIRASQAVTYETARQALCSSRISFKHLETVFGSFALERSHAEFPLWPEICWH